MEYRLEILDPVGARLRCFDEVPLLEVTLGGPDTADQVRGVLPATLDAIAPGYGIQVWLAGARVAHARVVSVGPLWGDARKLVLDEYVPFHEAIAFEALGDARRFDAEVTYHFHNKDAASIAKHLANSAPGPLHYGVAHTAYPDAAVREYCKAAARIESSNALEVGGVATGTWVGAPRLDASAAYAKDGHTVAGLVVDGVPWPDLRLMLVRAEETALNAAAIARHPEVADWSAAEYDASLYKHLADQARTVLQDRIDAWGIDLVELNPHRDAAGVLDGRSDTDGRLVGTAYGSGYGVNAALVELGPAEAWLDPEGRDLIPAWALKDYLSYSRQQVDTVDVSDVTLASFQVQGSIFEALCALAYAAGGFTFSIDAAGTLHFRERDAPDRVVEFDPRKHALVLGASDRRLVNRLRLRGDPRAGLVDLEHARPDSIAAYGERLGTIEYFPLSRPEDAATFADALLDDLAYPSPSGRIEFFNGDATLRPGQLLEIRGDRPRRVDPAAAGEWGGSFAGSIVGGVRALVHRIAGKRLNSIAHLGAPLRSVEDPLAYMVLGQESASGFFALRLDDAVAGTDTGQHLD
jgi:hypothetical protein